MAQRVSVALEDDLDGGPADQTVRFGIGASEYEIDLSEKNAAKLRERLAPFVGTPAGLAEGSLAGARGPRLAVSTAPVSALGPRGKASRSVSAAGSRRPSSLSTRPHLGVVDRLRRSARRIGRGVRRRELRAGSRSGRSRPTDERPIVPMSGWVSSQAKPLPLLSMGVRYARERLASVYRHRLVRSAMLPMQLGYSELLTLGTTDRLAFKKP